MKLDKMKHKWLSLSVVTVLFLSVSFIKIYSTLSISSNLDLIVLCEDTTLENGNPNSENDFSNGSLDLFFVDTQQFIFGEFSEFFLKTKSSFLIPNVFYDIQLLPPKVKMS